MPVVGVTAGPEWASLLVDVLDEIRATLDAKVTPAGMDINDDLSLRSGSDYAALLDVNYLELRTQAALLNAGTYPGALYKSSTGELYFNDDSGNQVALTSGGSVAAAAGNISGTGYGSSGVEVAWVSGDVAYEMRSGAGANDFAHLKITDLLLNDGSGNFARFQAPSLSSDLTFTLPSAYAGGSGYMVTMDASGNLGTTTTPTFATVTSSGHMVVSGSGRYKHGELNIFIPATAGAGDTYTSINSDGSVTLGAGNTWSIPIPLFIGYRIAAIGTYGNAGGSGSKSIELVRLPYNSTEAVVTSDTSTSSASPWSGLSVTPAHTILDLNFYSARFTAGNNGDRFKGISLFYDLV